MYYRTTRLGISVSTMEMLIKDDNGMDIAEFMFPVKTPQGDEYVFRYQLDEIGVPGWHLYPIGEGATYFATEKRHRNSLGVIPVNYSDSDIEQILNKVKSFPEVVIYILVPGHGNAEPGIDIVLFPMDVDTAGGLVSISSLSKYIVGRNRVAQKIGKILKGAVIINLKGNDKKHFEMGDKTELGQIKRNFTSEGFHIYISDSNKPLSNIPPCIRAEIENAVFTPFYFERKGDDQKKGLIVSADGKPVGEIRDVAAILERYGLMAQQKLRINTALRQSYENSKRDLRMRHQL